MLDEQISNGRLKTLSDNHYKMLLSESAISDDVIRTRGYFSINNALAANELGFNHQQAHTVNAEHPALIIPYHNPDGSLATYCMRPDNPRSIDDKKKRKLPDGTYPQKIFKYEMPKGAGNVLDTHPLVTPHLADPAQPLFFTEGAKKADSLISHGYHAINLNGVWGWRGTNAKQGRAALAGFDDIALNGRTCYLIFDSDVRSNDNIKKALRRFRSYLISKNAEVIPLLLPPTAEGKTGIDDYFSAGNTKADFENLIIYWTAFTPDLGGISSKQWTTEDIVSWYDENLLRFAINDMSEKLMFNEQPMTDTHAAVIRTKLRDDSVPISHAEDTQILIGNRNRYHPIKKYFRSLKWDGKSDHIALLASYFQDEQGIFYEWLKRWLIGAVAKVEGSGSNQNFMLVLDGGQGLGKSQFVRWLCPIPELFLESPLNPDDKDSLIRLISKFIWEVGELGSVTRRADREALKRIISMQQVTVRASYGKNDTDKPACASFIGTVNNEGGGFLNDPTGSRRYAVATITAIDWAYSTDINIDDIWAQAYALYELGEPWELRGDDAARRDEINSGYEQGDPLQDMVLTKFIVNPDKGDDSEWRLTSPQILNILSLQPDNRALTMRLATVLKSAGLKKSNPSRMKGQKQMVRYWQGIKIHTPPIL
jgi:hypothetical protein